MASENAKAVAREVIKKVQKGEKVVVGEIIDKQGYAPSMKSHPNKVTNTKSYKEETKPIVRAWEKERQRIAKEMKVKDLNDVQYEQLARVMDILTKNIQLLTGGATERTEDKFNDEQIDTIADRITSRKGSNGNSPSEERVN